MLTRAMTTRTRSAALAQLILRPASSSPRSGGSSVLQVIQQQPHASPPVRRRYAAAADGGAEAGRPPRVLVTGALGQIGTELVPLLRERYGAANVLASDVRKASTGAVDEGAGPFAYLDILNMPDLERLIVEHRIDWLVHNASILSAVGERNPQLALEINVKGFTHALEAAKRHGLRMFAPSSIAAFGPSTPREATPDLTVMRPTTVYGVSKLYAELLGDYYHRRWGVDFRSVRYPGVLSSVAPPGGGTTDYAVDIFYWALQKGEYKSFLRSDSALPMMYMPDCLKATTMLLEAPPESLKQRTYNVTAISFTPEELAAVIRKHIPHFSITYEPDFRQAIADSWPNSLDDSMARKDWGWNHDFDLDAMVEDMLAKLQVKLDIRN